MPITTREQLKSHIHSIHDYIRNSGAGYSMTAMKIFIFFYGLKIIEPKLHVLGLNITPFSELVKLAKKKNANEILRKIIDEEEHEGILYDLHVLKDLNLKEIICYKIPDDLKEDFYIEIVKLVNQIPTHKINDIEDIDDSETSEIYDVDVSGKLYEYFIGRDQTAISELGAYFTDRHITNYCIDQLQPQLLDNKIPMFIDPFGGSGGFTLNFVSYMNKHYNLNTDFWNSNIKNIHHHDMSHDVLKISGLEMFALTNVIPDMRNNFKRSNSFKCDFGGHKFKYIFSNPPYGGNSNKGSMIINDNKELLTELRARYYVKNKKTNKFWWSEKWAKIQYDRVSAYLTQHIGELETRQVNFFTSSNRIKSFIKDYDDTLTSKDKEFKLLKNSRVSCINDKESTSLILFMDLLDVNGTCIVVLKEGVFFDNKYTNIRKCLIDKFNVYKIVSVPSDQFENTTTKTSILFFRNDGKTTNIEFTELVVTREDSNVYDVVVKDDITELQLTKARGKIINVTDKQVAVASYNDIVKPTIINGKERYYYTLSYKKYMKDKDIKCSDDYELVRLGDIVKYMKKSKRPASFGSDTGKYKFYTSSNKVKYCDVADYSDNNLILIGNGGIGSIYIDNEFSCSDHMFVLKSNIATYCYWILLNFRTELYDNMNGSTIRNLGKDALDNFKIPIPKSKEKLNEWINKLTKPYERLCEKRIKLNELEQYIYDEIKRICDEEDCKDYALGDICNIKSALKSTLKKYYTTDKKHGFNTGKNLNGEHKMTYINDKGYDICKRYTVSTGDILIPEIYGVDSILVIVPDLWNAYVYKGSFKINEIKTNKYYLLYYCNSPIFKKQAVHASEGSLFKHVSVTILSKLKIKIPTNEKLLRRLDKRFQEVIELQESIKKTDDKYQTVLQELKDDILLQEEPVIDNSDYEDDDTDPYVSDGDNEIINVH